MTKHHDQDAGLDQAHTIHACLHASLTHLMDAQEALEDATQLPALTARLLKRTLTSARRYLADAERMSTTSAVAAAYVVPALSTTTPEEGLSTR